MGDQLSRGERSAAARGRDRARGLPAVLRRRLRRPSVRLGPQSLAALVAAAFGGGTAVAFLVVAEITATSNCGSACLPGSAWAPGAWAAALQLGLAWGALVSASGLVWSVAGARRRTAKLMWLLMFGLLLDWSAFTTTIASPVAVLGLLLAGGGGLFAIVLATGHRLARVARRLSSSGI